MKKFPFILFFSLLTAAYTSCKQHPEVSNSRVEPEQILSNYNEILKKYNIQNLQNQTKPALRLLITGNDIDTALNFNFIIVDFINGDLQDSIVFMMKSSGYKYAELKVERFDVLLPSFFYECFQPKTFDSFNLCKYRSLISDGQMLIYDYYSPQDGRIFFDRPILRGANIEKLPKYDWENMEYLDLYLEYLNRILKNRTGLSLNNYIGD